MPEATAVSVPPLPVEQATAIAVNAVTKRFPLPQRRRTTVKERLLQRSAGRDHDLFVALDDVSFEVSRGDFFGIVGKNGSGKSTLLRCIAGIYPPDAGSVTVDGRLASFIELGVGFNPELPARDNVILSSMLFGLSRREAAERFDDIIAFAELEPFRDLPLKNYSSGMASRLGFAVVAHVDAQTFLFDEVLAVGDGAFQEKCRAHFDRLRDAGKTVVIVSHDMNLVRSFCDRALLLHRGRIVASGAPDEVTRAYEDINAGRELAAPPPRPAPAAPGHAGRDPRPRPWGNRRIWSLATVLARSEFKLKYTGTALNYLWALARPLALFGVLLAVFTSLGRFGDGVAHYPVYLLTAVVLWTLFSQTTAASVGCLRKQASILRKQAVPHLAIPLSVALAGLFDLAINLALVLVVALASGIDPGVGWLAMPLLVALLSAFAVGMSLILAAAYVRHRDVEQIWLVASQALFYLTPIFYVVSALPDPFDRVIVLLNPIATIFTEMRHVFVDPTAPSAAEAIGDPILLIVPLAITGAAVALGLWAFRRESIGAAERL